MSAAGHASQQSEPALPVVVALVADNDIREDILRAMRGLAAPVFCSLTEDAETLVAARRALALLTTERDEKDQPVASLIERLRTRYPRLPIVVVLSGAAVASERERLAGHLPGITESVAPDRTLLRRRVATLITHGRHRERREEMASRLAANVPVAARDVVRQAIEHGDRPSSVRQLAMAIGVPRKTMDRRLSKAIPTTARQLIGWGRLIAAAMQLESSAMSVDSVAVELQFSSPSALRNLLQRYAGLTPTELRSLGGSEYLLNRLQQQLER